MNTELHLVMFNCRLHALEEMFVSLHPDKKDALSKAFMRNWEEAKKDVELTITKELKGWPT